MSEIKKENIRILEPQPTEETPQEVYNYPYGWRLKTTARYWIETTSHGQREVFQTLNPRTQAWNKPKKSTYAEIMIMYEDTANGHVHSYAFNGYSGGFQDIKELLDFCPIEKLSDYQKKQVAHFTAYYKANSHFTLTMVTNPTPEQQAEIDQHKKEYKELMPRLAHYYAKNPDETPEKVNERGSLKAPQENA